jgi:hypothetical protein
VMICRPSRQTSSSAIPRSAMSPKPSIGNIAPTPRKPTERPLPHYRTSRSRRAGGTSPRIRASKH